MFFIMVLTLQVKKIIYFQIEGMLKKEARSIWDLVPRHIYPHFGSNKLLQWFFLKKRQLCIKITKIVCVGVFTHMDGVTIK